MFVSALWIAPALLAVFQGVGYSRLHNEAVEPLPNLLFRAGDWLLYGIVTPIIFLIAKRWPLVRPHLKRRLAIHAAFALLFCFVWAVTGKLLELGIVAVADPDRLRAAINTAGSHLFRNVATNVAEWILTTLPFGVVVYTTVAGLAFAIAYFTEARDRDLQMARLAEQLSTARYAALQAQVNPHFLFNTLNTIAVLVRDNNRTEAVEVVEHLSELLRKTLSKHRADEVTLASELELVQEYLAIEKARFPDRLAVSIDADTSLMNAAVPSFALQHLVENAIRHGIAPSTEGGKVTIGARRVGDMIELTVRDNGVGIVSAPSTEGHGLDNTRQRLSALYADKASLTLEPHAGGGSVATIRLPYRELKSDAHVT